MKRVASLYLPHWAIDRVRRAERPRSAPPPESPTASGAPDLLALKAKADAEHGGKVCDAPKNTGWRPGARWARDGNAAQQSRADVERRIAAMPAHQRPPMRELGRRSEAAEMPFRLLPGDDGNKAQGWEERTGSNDPHAAPPAAGRYFDGGTPHAAQHRAVGTPLVTVQKTGSRVEIAAVSLDAAALGIVPGMALTHARASVPALDVRDADPAGDRADLERLAVLLARRWCPVVAMSDADGLLLDISGTAHLHGGEARMAHRIVRLLARAGITARIAIADTAGAAWALVRHACFGGPLNNPGQAPPRRRPGPSDDVAGSWAPAFAGEAEQSCTSIEQDGVILLPPDAHIPALAPLPVAALRVDDTAIELARRLGIDTIGELAALPRAPLVRRFGRAVATRLDQATGAAGEPLDPVVPPAPIMVERRFAEPIATAEAIHHWLGGLVADLSRALAGAGLGVRALVLACARVDSTVQPIRIGLARPTRDAAHILRLIARRIEEVEPGYGIDALALHVLRADLLGAEALGAALAGEDTPDLAPLVDTLANRIGTAKLWRTRPQESDVPERSVTSCPPLDPERGDVPTLKVEDVRQLDTRTPDDAWHPRWPRPVRLLRRPERIEHVLAELPDFPPARFTWRGRTHRIVRGDGPERIFGEWWRRPAERAACRDYFRVEDEAGRRFWLFRRGDGRHPETGDLSWYLHGAFG